MGTKQSTVTAASVKTKTESTNTAARALIAEANAARDAKTKRLRAARIAAEAEISSTTPPKGQTTP